MCYKTLKAKVDIFPVLCSQNFRSKLCCVTIRVRKNRSNTTPAIVDPLQVDVSFGNDWNLELLVFKLLILIYTVFFLLILFKQGRPNLQ